MALDAALVTSTGYLLTLLIAARDAATTPSCRRIGPTESPLRLAVLVPSYNEEAGIGNTLDSLFSCPYAEDMRRIIVIADNCTDQTGERAKEAGAEVWQREDAQKRGKGFALAWALDRLHREEQPVDAVVIVDADCTVSPNFLSAIGQRLGGGADAVQVDYVAGNPNDSHVSALRFAGFALTNTVRYMGKQRLGLSCGLAGTGMAFTRNVLHEAPWTVTGLVEDAEYHLQLVMSGKRVEFLPEAWVSQPVPTSVRVSTEQQSRWEQGRWELTKQWSFRLIAAGLARGDASQLHAGVECLVPPQSILAVGSLGSMAGALALRSRGLLLLCLATLVGQTAFVLGGLRLVRAPISVYRALLMAPTLIVAKIGLYVRLLSGKGPTSWVRTEREARPAE